MVLLVACRPKALPAEAPVDEGPPIQLEQVYVEERREGHIVWSARAPAAKGSAQRANVTELTLQVNAAGGGPGGLSLAATRSTLALETGEIVLYDLAGHDERGLVFTTAQARFSRHTQALRCEHPVQLQSPLGELQAAGAEVLWAAGEVDFVGPITGRIVSFAPAPGRP